MNGLGVPFDAVALCKLAEGFHREVRLSARVMAVPYLCPAGFWTIGYGRLCAKDHPAVTLEQGESFLAEDLVQAVGAALRHCPVLLAEPEQRLAAVASFVFNLGPGRLQSSTFRRRVNERDWQGARRELMRWVHGGGRVLPGLVTRRRAEGALLNLENWREAWQ